MKKDKLKKERRKSTHTEIPLYNDPENKDGRIPTDVLGSYSGVPLDREKPIQDVDDL